MRVGILDNIAGNIDALKDVDKRFDAFQVEAKVCLGHVVGLYPYIDECVKLLMERRYVVLKHFEDDAFIAHFDGLHDYGDWSQVHLANALRFARGRVSRSSVNFLRQLPERCELGFAAFESRLTSSGQNLTTPDQVAAAFALSKYPALFHTASTEPYVWYDNLTGACVKDGLTQLEPHCRTLIAPGSAGCRYGSSPSPSALLYDEHNKTILRFSPICDAHRIFANLREIEFPPSVLGYLERNEYTIWRQTNRHSGQISQFNN